MPPDRRLGNEAIDWLVLLHSGRATGADRAAFAAWRRRSSAHQAAARQADALWQSIPETLTAARTTFPAERRRGVPTRRAVLTGAIAASGAALVVGSGVLGPMAGLYADHTTRVGERRDMRLPDGSLAALNTATALSVSYSEAERRVILHEGEALFDVVRDPGRPFIVSAANGEAQALGTVFSVRRSGQAVGVVVAEGAVEVWSGNGRSARIRLAAGERTDYGAGAPPSEPARVDAMAATAWRGGKLVFNRRPLGEVAAELERYRAGQIVIADEQLKALEVSGIFDLADPDGLLRTVEQTMAVKVARLPLLTLVY